ncbi:tetratricopeptide repeat protein [Actinoalloteichus hymeniacidonis]|nr:hypothetical protein [Actinoalloteichus hymeniacidonis]MBB5909153.1 tetratricopeptide (TPR) repeat protein [Actinoalloteichus hymeniacidonis]
MSDDRDHTGAQAEKQRDIEALSPEARHAWRYLAALPSPSTPGLAAAALGMEQATARRLLDELAGRSLLVHTHDRYEFEAGGRELASAQGPLDEQGSARVAQRATDWVVHSAANANQVIAHLDDHTLPCAPASEGVQPDRFTSREQAWDWCKLWTRDLVPWVRFAVANGLTRRAWELPVVWWEFLFLTKPWVVWRTSAKAALRAARAAQDTEGVAWMLHSLGIIAIEETDWDRASAYLDEALQVRSELEDRREFAWTLIALIRAELDRQSIDEVPVSSDVILDRLEQAEREFTELGRIDGLSSMWSYRAQALHYRGREAEAEAAQRKAAELADQIDAPLLAAFTLTRLAEMRLAKGEFDGAVVVAQAAADQAREIGWLWCVINAATSEGTAHRAAGRAEEARRAWETALTVALQLGDVRAEALERRLAEL